MKLIACNRTRSGELEMNRRNQMGRYWADSHWVGRRNRTESDVAGRNREESGGIERGQSERGRVESHGIGWRNRTDSNAVEVNREESGGIGRTFLKPNVTRFFF